MLYSKEPVPRRMVMTENALRVDGQLLRGLPGMVVIGARAAIGDTMNVVLAYDGQVFEYEQTTRC